MNFKMLIFSVFFLISAASNGWAEHRMLGAAAILGSAFLLSWGVIDEDRGRYYPISLVIVALSIITIRLLTSYIWIDNLVLIIAVSLVILEPDISISRLKVLLPMFRVLVASIPICLTLFILFDGLNEEAALLLVGSCLLASVFSWRIDDEFHRLINHCGLLLGVAGWYFRTAHGISMDLPDPVEAAQLNRLVSYFMGPIFGFIVHEAIRLYSAKSLTDGTSPIGQEPESN